MLPELRSQLADMVTGLVSSGRLVWSGDEVHLGTGREEWDVIELSNVWNGVSWWPNALLAQVLDLIQNLHFERAALANREVRGSELSWIFAKFQDLKRDRDRHIATFAEPRLPRAAYIPEVVRTDVEAWKRVAMMRRKP